MNKLPTPRRCYTVHQLSINAATCPPNLKGQYYDTVDGHKEEAATELWDNGCYLTVAHVNALSNEDVYGIGQTVTQQWLRKEDVHPIVDVRRTRSIAAGDIIENQGVKVLVTPTGFKEL